MRKIMWILIVCILFLCGCGGFAENPSLTTFRSGSRLFRPLITLKTQEEIEAFSKSDLAPSGFVKPEDLSMFGNPENTVSFFPEADGKTYTYKRYMLFVNDENGILNYIQVDHSGFPGYETRYTQENLTDTELSKTQGMKNMLRLETDDVGLITCGEIKYFYLWGKLETIIFHIGNIEFSIKYIREIDDYPMDGADTFLKRLLSVNEREASAAVEEFRLAILRRNAGRILIPAGIGLGAVVVVVTGIVFWKKKKRKATVNKAEEPTTEPQPQPADPLE